MPLRALATGVARALAAIHSAGLVHRDLKPANVLITPAGPRVIDFGIAQQVGDSGGPTGPGLVVGSPGWIPPERLNRQPATPASDVFGWGCIVGYAGSGRNPFGAGDPDELAQRTMRDPPNLEGLDDSLRGPVTQALNKDPAGRPNAAELLAWLRSPYIREAENPDFGQTLTLVDPGGTRASDGMPKTGDREEFPRDPGTRTPAAAPAVLPRRQVGEARASTGGPAPGSSLAPIARADAGHDEDTGDTRRLRRAPPSAPIAVAVTAAAALVAFLVTTAADTDGTPTAPPAGEHATPPSSPAPSHGSRRPISGTHPPTTDHTSVPRTSRSSPPPAARPDVPSAPVDQGSNAGGQGNGNGKGNGQAKEKNKNK
jgi:serine/threonine protein kinase